MHTKKCGLERSTPLINKNYYYFFSILFLSTIPQNNHLPSYFQIVPDPNAIIGKWKMDIDTKNRNLDGAVSYTMKHPFYVIFNPWCEGISTRSFKNN